MVNIYDSANQLASDLQKTNEFKALQEAVAGVKNNKDSLALFKKMDKLQTKIIDAQRSGKDLTKEDQKDYKDLNEKVQKDVGIIKLLKAEQGLYKTVDDVQKTFTEPINDLYDDIRN
ncbi:YlbF family regulator [Lactobacillus acetotolerans]|uniref:YlbF family regulator n=1 Tax=Lactobacillus acetotolerans TaxID=1600 RepID=UPI00145140BF|nr:YlbF family regulator [Lactobacillus acetotolerans]QJD73829.1 YlbF family regulator [Lactobacillus acetotolerans]